MNIEQFHHKYFWLVVKGGKYIGQEKEYIGKYGYIGNLGVKPRTYVPWKIVLL